MSDGLRRTDPFEAGVRRRLVTVHSQKGGVGKTMLSLYLASRMASDLGQNTVLVDADLTGTSLTDVLELRAPSPGGRFYGQSNTINLLKQMSAESRRVQWLDSPPPGPKMLNHFLFCNPWIYDQALKLDKARTQTSFSIADLLWRWEDKIMVEGSASNLNLKKLRVIPSSGFSGHLASCLPHIYKEDLTGYMESRLADLVRYLWYPPQKEPVINIVIDTPPVLGGISKAILRLHSSTEPESNWPGDGDRESLAHIAVFITSVDAQDLMAFARGLDELASDGHISLSTGEKEKSPAGLLMEELLLVINKVPEDPLPVRLPEIKRTKTGANQFSSASREYRLDRKGDARLYSHECIRQLYSFQSQPLRDEEAVKKLFTGTLQAPVLYHKSICGSLFLRGKQGRIFPEVLEPVFDAVTKARPRDEYRSSNRQ